MTQLVGDLLKISSCLSIRFVVNLPPPPPPPLPSSSPSPSPSIVRQCKWPSLSRTTVEIQKSCYYRSVTSHFALFNEPIRSCSKAVSRWQRSCRSCQRFAAYNCCFCASDEKGKRKHDNVNALVRFVREPTVG